MIQESTVYWLVRKFKTTQNKLSCFFFFFLVVFKTFNIIHLNHIYIHSNVRIKVYFTKKKEKKRQKEKKSQCFSNKHQLEIQVILNQVRRISVPTEAHKHKHKHKRSLGSTQLDS